MAISKRLRYEILQRDDFTCRYCHATDVPLTIDHVVPVTLGGDDTPSNLVTACKDCNAGKSSISPHTPLVAAVSDDALRWAAAMKQAAEVQRADQRAIDAYLTQFYDAWEPCYSLPHGWQASVTHWYELGVEIEFLLDCLDRAFAARGIDWRWKYFCGIVWRRIQERQDIARDIIARDGED